MKLNLLHQGQLTEGFGKGALRFGKHVASQLYHGLGNIGAGTYDTLFGLAGSFEEPVHGPVHAIGGLGEVGLGAAKIALSPLTGLISAGQEETPVGGELGQAAGLACSPEDRQILVDKLIRKYRKTKDKSVLLRLKALGVPTDHL